MVEIVEVRPPSRFRVWMSGIVGPAVMLALYAAWGAKSPRFKEVYLHLDRKMSQRSLLANIALETGPYLWIAMALICFWGWRLLARNRPSAALTWFRWTQPFAVGVLGVLIFSILADLIGGIGAPRR